MKLEICSFISFKKFFSPKVTDFKKCKQRAFSFNLRICNLRVYIYKGIEDFFLMFFRIIVDKCTWQVLVC